MALQNICVVSIIPFSNSTFETAFKDGLGPLAPANYLVRDNLGYDINNLRANGVNQAAPNTLVVTVGGLTAALAADGTTVPYIALTGADFTPSGIFLGGISLDVAKHHIEHLGHLNKGKGKRTSKTCLLYNGANMNFTSQENTVFSYTQPANIDQNTPAGNVAGIYNAAFAAIDNMQDPGGGAANIEAIIVSADAFFTQTKDALITAAANPPAANRYLVYPFQDYTMGAVHLRPNFSTIHGPKLSLVEIYCKLGLKAKLAMKAGNVNWDHEPLGDPEDK
jgi:hypothetical protein